jgi:outer membrane protein insertion porin family
MRCLERVLTAAFLVSAPLSVLAQGTTAAPAQDTATAAATSIDRITFMGADAYSDSDLLHVIRLHTGDTVTQPMITAAAQALYDSGLFTDVNAGFDFTDGVHTLIFHLKPVPDDQLLHVSFANLIWFTTDDINAAIHKAIPIYQGKIADQSKFADQIQLILNGMLDKQHIAASLSHEVVAPTPQHPYRALEFRVTDPPIRLVSATVVGGPVALVNAEVTAQKNAIAAAYNQGTAGVTTEDILLAPVIHAGYIGAKLTDVKVQLSTTPQEIRILYYGRIDSGPLYKVGTVAWTSTEVYSADDFERDSELHTGSLPHENAVEDTRKSILSAYQKKGYINADVEVSTALNDQDGSVNYTFSVVPGDVYHVNTVTVTGLSGEALSDFNANFQLRQGSVLDISYIDNFLSNNTSLAALKGYGFSYQTSENTETHQVDLTLAFSLQH